MCSGVARASRQRRPRFRLSKRRRSSPATDWPYSWASVRAHSIRNFGHAAVATYAKGVADRRSQRTSAPATRCAQPGAERQLAAATARVGVATAELFPRVNVTGFVGFLSGDVGRLFSASEGGNSRAWSVAPTVSWAAFDIGSVRARLRASEAQSDAAAANYEKVVLTALEDTENSFVAYSAQQAQLKSLSEQAQASRRAAELADTQYREGVATSVGRAAHPARGRELGCASRNVRQRRRCRDLQGPGWRRAAVE